MRAQSMEWKLYLILVLLVLHSVAVQSTWRFLSQLSLHAVGRGVMCDSIPGLLDQQRKLCRKYPEVMRSIGRGVQIGVKECQYQFKNHRWNCTTIDNRDPSLFGKLSLKGSREVAFVYAISSAGVVFAITKACTSGELPNCACDRTKRGGGQDEKGEFQWTGCSDNVRYGSHFSKVFIDAKEKTTRDARGLMNLHNNRVGRKAVERFVRLKCKCQGVSGSCSLRTCWQAMQDFHRMGDYIKLKYNAAVRATISQDGTSLSTVSDRDQLSKEDLVYLEKSPDYCLMDTKTGAAGTSGRVCNRTSNGPDGCEQMCCGRGFNTRTTHVTNNCGCKFRWCCDVKCKQCTEVTDVHTCKETPR